MSLKHQSLSVDGVFPRIPSTNDKYKYSTELDLRKAKELIFYTQFRFGFLKGFLKVSVHVRLDIPGGPQLQVAGETASSCQGINKHYACPPPHRSIWHIFQSFNEKCKRVKGLLTFLLGNQCLLISFPSQETIFLQLLLVPKINTLPAAHPKDIS